MILTDNEISGLVASKGIIQADTFDPDCITNIGYDIRAKEFYDEEGRQTDKLMLPGESVIVAAEEIIKLPSDMVAVIKDKNSRIRQGLLITSPIYQPGHETRVFFRITNLSSDEIKLRAGESYAMITFERLSGEVNHPYDGTFKDEVGTYTGLSGYKEAYERQIHKIEKKTEDIKDIEKSIYANVLAILAVFVAIFSLISTNVKLLENESTLRSFIGYNLVTIGGISFLLTLLRTTILNDLSRKKMQGRFWIWVPTIVIFAAAFVVLLFIK